MRSIIASVLILLSGTAMADGWSDLGGVNGSGEYISVYPASIESENSPPEDADLFKVLQYKDAKARESPKTFEQRCMFKHNRAGDRIAFECKKGQSPLAGATYKIVPSEDPGNCDYEAIYVCVAGCRSKRTPTTMVKHWWECE